MFTLTRKLATLYVLNDARFLCCILTENLAKIATFSSRKVGENVKTII